MLTSHMNNKGLHKLVYKYASHIHEDQLGFWKFDYKDTLVYLITDESHDRMRAMSPIIRTEEIDVDEWQVMMDANFDRAVDARYCSNEGYLWSAFIHPLSQLSSEQFLDALNQVVTLAKNFRGSYSSSSLVFKGKQLV